MRTAWRTRPVEDETLSFCMAAARWVSTVGIGREAKVSVAGKIDVHGGVEERL